jgi:hypothetical protein
VAVIEQSKADEQLKHHRWVNLSVRVVEPATDALLPRLTTAVNDKEVPQIQLMPEDINQLWTIMYKN